MHEDVRPCSRGTTTLDPSELGEETDTLSTRGPKRVRCGKAVHLFRECRRVE